MGRWLYVRWERLRCRFSKRRREELERIHRVESMALARGSRKVGGPQLADATAQELRAAATFNRRRARQLARANQRKRRVMRAGWNQDLAKWLDGAADRVEGSTASIATLGQLPRREYEALCLEAHDLVFRDGEGDAA
jgi:hypothetical protein